MTDFIYDDFADLDSDAVASAWYNASDLQLAVELANNNVYVYSDVTRPVYEALVGAPSVGRYYATVLKPYYGPGENLGWGGNVRVVPRAEKPVATDASPTANVWTIAPDAKITHSGETTFPLTVGESTTRRYTVVFTVGDLADRKSYTFLADSEQSVLDNMTDLGNALGLEFKVKEVTGYFSD